MTRDPRFRRRLLAGPSADPAATGVHPRRARSVRHARALRHAHARAAATLAGALVWLLVGCCSLLWTIAFTTDTRSMTIGLAVWVFAFVVPSTLATVVADRLDKRAPDAPVAAGD